MKNIKVNIKLNKFRINSLQTAAIKSLEETSESVKTELIKEQYMPFDVGTMQNESTFIDTKKSKFGLVKLVTNTPYARRMYYHPEYNFSTLNNKNARGMWYEPFISGKYKNFAKKTFMALYKRNGGV